MQSRGSSVCVCVRLQRDFLNNKANCRYGTLSTTTTTIYIISETSTKCKGVSGCMFKTLLDVWVCTAVRIQCPLSRSVCVCPLEFPGEVLNSRHRLLSHSNLICITQFIIPHHMWCFSHGVTVRQQKQTHARRPRVFGFIRQTECDM